ncbi:hypothetical protein BDN72DRAFT_906316 [Pluteus cervinus]|uniref:Uncharacterized protein n=1 Tax=Pluteus cervinus TaxID=181527 RepID=A0ACD2ZZM5_9AGAR|nr:hypothetical protein BDN72DRAFT_906316 [Pluteus cervinus]
MAEASLRSDLGKLIPVLRVSGYHQRLYTLDAQVQHLDFANLKRRSKKQGQTAVEEVIRLGKAYEVQKQPVLETEKQLQGNSDDYVHALASIDIHDAHQAFKRAETQLRIKERMLGIGEKEELMRLINDPYIALRMNALALKMRLREKLRARKFELDPVERKARKFTPNHEKLVSHTDSSVRRHDPTVKQIARAYNKTCEDIKRLVKKKKRDQRPTCPSKVPMDGLFSLDINDDIWQDAGLSDDAVGQPPLWLSNEKVRAGVKAMLERDRCVEEEAQLEHERRAMQTWFSEEWTVVNEIILNSDTDNPGLCYAFKQRKSELCILQVIWSDVVGHLSSGPPSLPPLPAWGPSTEEDVAARVQYFTLSTQNPQASNMDSELDEPEEHEEHVSGSGNDSDQDEDVVYSILDIVSAAYPSEFPPDETEDEL